jgi:superfamily II DNA or RNA helicase
MPLRPYQQELFDSVRALIVKFDFIMMQLATGGGKTWIFSSMIASALSKDNPAWIIVPRNELLLQSSEQLRKMKVPHGIISAKSNESRAFKVHVVSKDTLIRRIKAGKIKNWPKVIIFDEAHLALDQQLFIRESAPEGTKFIGVTATPEKLDGRGLDEMYQDITYGPTIKELVEMGYLTNMRYFCPPGFDFEALKSVDFSGTEVKQDVLDQILKKRQVYGNAINHYRKYAQGKSTIVFCRSVKAAEETAQRFRDSGFNFESIDGKMTDKKRKALIDGLRTGRVDGLTSCELITYGLDVPRVECVIMLRPTLSRTLFFQMIGRGLRPFEFPDGTIKDYCIILDHVGNLKEHGHPIEPYDWKFHGKEKRGREKGESVASLKLCTKCWLYYSGSSCDNCGADRQKSDKKYQEIEGRLIEIKGPVKLNDRDPEDRREIQDKIGALIDKINGESNGSIPRGPVSDLLKLAEDIGRNAMWVYWRLSKTYIDDNGVEQERKTVNLPLLHAIREIKGYKPGWVFMQKNTIAEKLGREA